MLHTTTQMVYVHFGEEEEIYQCIAKSKGT